jgi:hypothetical protein
VRQGRGKFTALQVTQYADMMMCFGENHSACNGCYLIIKTELFLCIWQILLKVLKNKHKHAVCFPMGFKYAA